MRLVTLFSARGGRERATIQARRVKRRIFITAREATASSLERLLGGFAERVMTGDRDINLVAHEPPSIDAREVLEQKCQYRLCGAVVVTRGAVDALLRRELLARGALEIVSVRGESDRSALIEACESAVERVTFISGATELERRLTYHIDNSPLVAIEWDANFHCRSWPPNAERLFGWRAEEVIGRHPSEWNFVHEADAPRVAKQTAALASGEVQRSTDLHRNYRSDHSIGYFEWHSSAQTDAHGKLSSVLSLVLDATARVHTELALVESEKRARLAVEQTLTQRALVSEVERKRRETEDRFRMLADNMAQLAWVADAAGDIIWYNRRWHEYTGVEYTGEASITDAPPPETLHPDHAERVLQKFRAHIQSGTAWEDMFPLRGANGTYRWFLSRAEPIRDDQDEIKCWFGTNTDITAQRDAESAFREADRRKDEFIAMLAHELRNPLAPIRSGIELMRRIGTTDSRVARVHDVIDRQVGHMVHLVDDLLDVSRIGRGKLKLEYRRVDIATVARQTAEDFRGNLESAGLDVRVRIPLEPIWVDGDKVRIAQMIGNLLHNAGRFTERGGSVEVECRRDPSRDAALVIVRDTGIGMDEALLSRLFDPFSQADQDLARSKGGLGLGLAVTKGLAELHGGRVIAQSEGTSRGSTFELTIPLSAAIRRPSEPGIVVAANNPLHVLLIEDNVDAAHTLAELLELDGHDVSIANDGRAGVTLALRDKPDVVVSDLGLPGELDGYQVARTIRSTPGFESVRMIALSGYANESARALSRDAGFDAHLAKPADMMALDRELRAATAAYLSGAATSASPRDSEAPAAPRAHRTRSR